MGIFDRLFNAAPSTNYTPSSEQEAWIAIMYACIAVDGDVSEIEIDFLSRQLVFKTIFKGHDLVGFYKTVRSAHQQVGSKVLIDNSVANIQEESKPTVFALVMELLLADGVIGEKEQEIAEYLTEALKLDDSTAEKIVEVMLIKNEGNVLVV